MLVSASAELKTANQRIWAEATTHPFCRELADGTLPPAKMVAYLVQDYTFIDAFVRLAASAIAHAPSLADSVPLAQFLAVITGPENTYFLRSFDALGVKETQWRDPELWPVTRDFQQTMRDAAQSGSYEKMITVLIVAEWVYLSWASPVNPPENGLPFYFSEWITLHAGPDFEGVVAYLRGQLDKLWPTFSPGQQDGVRRAFEHMVMLEKRFFDAAYAA
ncbi:MAG: TenA family protein [Stappiaceae bacterium]